MTNAEKLKQYAVALSELLTQKEKAELELDKTKEDLKILMPEVVQFMKDNGIKKSEVYDGIGALDLVIKELPYIKEENRKKVFDYLRSIGEGDLIKVKEDIHHKTLEGYYNDLVKSNKPVPEGIETYVREEVKIKSK